MHCSGVFSTGATGAIAPAIFRKRLIAPAILHLSDHFSSLDFNIYVLLFPTTFQTRIAFSRGKLLQKFLLRFAYICLLYYQFFSYVIIFKRTFLQIKSVQVQKFQLQQVTYLLLRGETFRGRALFGSSFAMFTFRVTLSIGN